MPSLPEILVPSYEHKWTSLGELLTSGNSVSADMTSQQKYKCTILTSHKPLSRCFNK